jgi:hypothetical protein
MKTFHVLEPHLAGTSHYKPGDKREADENEVKHLLDLGVLSEKAPAAAKAEKAAANKGEKAPENKADA